MPNSPLPAPAKLPLSAFIICQDEADYLENCIRSLGVCAEIVVVDSGSTDSTLPLLERLTAEGFPLRVLHQPWLGYAAQKQKALEQCTQPWCLNIDADERLDRELQAGFPALLEAGQEISAWSIMRRNYLIGFGYTPSSSPEHHLVRLVRRGRAHYDPTMLVHETLVVSGTVREVPSGSLLHYRPLRLEDQILKENRYSTLKAQQLERGHISPRPIKAILGPFWYFIKLFFLRRLYRCGWAGFIEAGTGSVYAFLTEAKLIQNELEARKPPRESADV